MKILKDLGQSWQEVLRSKRFLTRGSHKLTCILNIVSLQWSFVFEQFEKNHLDYIFEGVGLGNYPLKNSFKAKTAGKNRGKGREAMGKKQASAF